jgi:hypothetical protein
MFLGESLENLRNAEDLIDEFVAENPKMPHA